MRLVLDPVVARSLVSRGRNGFVDSLDDFLHRQMRHSERSRNEPLRTVALFNFNKVKLAANGRPYSPIHSRMMQLLTAEDCSIVNTFQDVAVHFRSGISPSLLATLICRPVGFPRTRTEADRLESDGRNPLGSQLEWRALFNL